MERFQVVIRIFYRFGLGLGLNNPVVRLDEFRTESIVVGPRNVRALFEHVTKHQIRARDGEKGMRPRAQGGRSHQSRESCHGALIRVFILIGSD